MAGRNYLFAGTEDDADLARFISTAATVTGFLKGTAGGPLPGWYRMGGDNAPFLRTLHDRVAAAYPQGGQPFFAVRLWTNLLWQPAYLAVIAVHVHGALPELTLLAQSRQNVDVDGYRLPAGPQFRGPTEEMIARAGRELRAMADALLAEINAVTKLKRVPALRLLTDRMIGLMVRLRQYAPGTTVADQYRWCALWLDAMGLTGHGGLETLVLADGREVAITARKGCCLDYLAFPDTYCSDCPRLKRDERLARQRANILAEIEAES
jgi:siderophore ferric iron reductase